MESLSFYEVEKAAEITGLVLGTVAPSSSEDLMLKVVNDSDIYQASEVSVSVTGDDAVQLWLSADGDTFGPTLELGDISPGGNSDAFWLRRVTVSTEPAAGCTATLAAVPAAWKDPIDTNASDNIPLTVED